MTTPTDTAKLADEIEALATRVKRAHDFIAETPRGYSIPLDAAVEAERAEFDLAKYCTANLPAIIFALRERDALKDEVERLRAQDWQPIETAPKDGIIQLYVPKGFDGRPLVRQGEWHNTTLRQPGWLLHHGPDLHARWQPTHWRPLPAPPSRAALGGGG